MGDGLRNQNNLISSTILGHSLFPWKILFSWQANKFGDEDIERLPPHSRALVFAHPRCEVWSLTSSRFIRSQIFFHGFVYLYVILKSHLKLRHFLC